MTAFNRILLMTPSEHEFERLKTIIYEMASSDCAIDWISDFDAGKETLSLHNYELCLVDCNIGADIATSMVRAVKQMDIHAPVIMLYDQGDYETALRGISIGASDALEKQSITSSKLKLSIENSLARQQFSGAERQTKDQLIKDNQELTERCKIAQDYAGHVSHQIRTPLTVIKSYAAILANNIAGQLNTKQIEHLTKIVDQTDNLNNMLTSMLEKATTSAPQKGKLDAASLGKKVEFKSVNDQSSLAQPARLDPPSDTKQTKRVDEASSSDVEEVSSPQSVSHSRGTVLIVDDDPNIIDVFTVLIGNLGFNVICASDGRECLAKFTMHDIDVMILDLAIAGDDGLNIYQKVLDYEFSERDNTPAILLTGSANEDIITRSSNVGAHYVLKNGDAWENVQRILTDWFKLNGANSGSQEPISEYAISA